MKNYYKILQLDQSAEKEVIEAAYRRLVKKYHPDKLKKKDEYSNAKIRDIIEAYKILRDDNKRHKYDVDLLRFTFNKNINTNYGKEVEPLVQRSIYCRCSKTSKLYIINLIKKPGSKSQYIISSIESASEEKYASEHIRYLISLEKLYYGIRALILRESTEKNNFQIGDIAWGGVNCPECNTEIEIRKNTTSSFAVCIKCHRLSCLGNAIKGMAGYYSACPWCGNQRILYFSAKPVLNRVIKILGEVSKNSSESNPRLPVGKMLKDKE